MKSRGLVNHRLHVCGQAGHAAGVGRGVARVPRLRPLLRLLLRPLLRPLAAGAVPAGAGRVGGRGGRARVRQVPGVVPRAGLLVPILYIDTLQPHCSLCLAIAGTGSRHLTGPSVLFRISHSHDMHENIYKISNEYLVKNWQHLNIYSCVYSKI